MHRVLLVTYDFPPSGGSGVQRVAKLAKYLPTFGWKPIVLTTGHGRYSNPPDSTLLRDIEDIEIHRTWTPDLYSLLARWKESLGLGNDRRRVSPATAGHRQGPWHPSAWLIPDGKLPWIIPALKWAKSRCLDERAQVVLSTLPTPTAAILGSLIARAWNVPHIIDYRDPWSGAFYLPRRLGPLRNLELALERRILAKSVKATIVPGFARHLPKVDTPIEVIHNGFDESDFTSSSPVRPAGDFVIAHIGILWEGRDVEPLNKALILLNERIPELKNRIHFIQVGRIDKGIASQLERLSIHFKTTTLASVPHLEAIGYMLGADLLYLPLSFDHIPGKTYEYLRSRTPILAVGSEASHVRSLLAETGAGVTLAPADTSGMARFIEDVMTNGHAAATFSARAGLEKYSRESQAGQFARVLDDAVRGGTGRQLPTAGERCGAET